MVSQKVSALALMAAAASAAPSDNLHVLQARQGAIIDGFHSGMTNFRQTVDTLTHQLTTNGGHAGADILGTVLTGIDAQIDNAGGTIATALAPFTGGLSLAVGNFLLGPFVQSVTNGAEVAIGNIVGGAADLVAAPVRMAFSHSLSNLATQAKQYNIDTTRLEAANNKLRATFSMHQKRSLVARQGAIIDGFHSGMTNFRQTVDTLTHQLTTNGGHAGADILGTVLTGIDAQIDNAGGTIATALAPFTGGLSLAVGNFLLGPFVQSVTNGAEVAIGNIVGGAADLVAAPVRMAFSHSLSNLATQAKQYNIDTTRLEAANNKLRATFA